jgi:glucokinase
VRLTAGVLRGKLATVVLVGDIGGTHARLSLLAPGGRTVRHEVLESRKYPSLEAVIRAFLGATTRNPKVTAAALGVAGPVVDGRCVATNLPWVVDARLLARKLALKRVTLLNDLVALSLGALGVPRAKLHLLGDAGAPKKKGANVAVLAAGTGLGEAILVWDSARFVPTATEGGHADFGPSDDLEVELLQFLRAGFGHVSWERVLSGDGLGNLYDFFRQAKGIPESAENARLLGAAADRNAVITELGVAGKSEAAARAVQLFASIYGAEAGNLALKALAVGGVYVCGNIAVHMLPVFEQGGFRRAFADKGRFAPLMEKIPVAVVLDSDVGLAGAARVALGG